MRLRVDFSLCGEGERERERERVAESSINSYIASESGEVRYI